MDVTNSCVPDHPEEHIHAHYKQNSVVSVMVRRVYTACVGVGLLLWCSSQCTPTGGSSAVQQVTFSISNTHILLKGLSLFFYLFLF